jgi:hypothetical protein
VDHVSGAADGLTVLALAQAYGVDPRAASRERIRGALSKMLPVILKATTDAKKIDPSVARWNALALVACHDIGLAVPDAATGNAVPVPEPPSLDVIIKAQSSDGGWSATPNGPGRAYTTAMSVLSLTTVYNLLPVYAR